jgi:cholesterol oxidase
MSVGGWENIPGGAQPAKGRPSVVLETDVLIIGSGFGGAVAAARLTEAGRDVVMLERGPWRDTLPATSMNVRDRIALPRASLWHMISKSLSTFTGHRLTGARGLPFNRRHGMFELSNHRGLFSACTNQVGGGSLAWAGAVARPLRPDYWDGRAEGVSEEIMAPHFERVWNELEVAPFPLSEPGAVNWAKELSDQDWLDFSAGDGAQWAHRMPGSDKTPTYPLGIQRASSQFTGHLSLGCLDGSKASTDSIWLGPAMARGLKLIASCRVTRIRRTDDGYLVYAQRTGGELELQVRCRSLLMGAGTINTLRLLMEAEKCGDLESMPALGQGISGNGDEMALMWNVKAAKQKGIRNGLGSIFHLRHGSRKLVHGFIETDLPRPRWRILRRLLRPLFNSMLVVSMGPDGSYGQAGLVGRRMVIHFDAGSTKANRTGRSENREVAKRLGVKALFFPKAVTVHLCGGARVGPSATKGVVNGDGECWTNPGLFVVDAAGIPGAPGSPPSYNIAVWASHVAEGITSREPERNTTVVQADVSALLARAERRQLSALFSMLPHDPDRSGDMVGRWQALLLVRVQSRCPRRMRVEIEQVSETLETLKPSAGALPGAVPASAWDGSGLCWQWRGKCSAQLGSGQLTDIQFRPLPDSDRMLARVRQHDGPEGWYLLVRAG